MIEIRSFRDLLRLFFIFRREFKIAVIFTALIIVLGAFLLPSKYEASARLLVKPSRENSTVPIEMTNRQTLYAPSTQRDPVVDEEKLLTGKLISQRVAADFLQKIENYKPTGYWDAFKHSLKKAGGKVKEGARQLLVMLQILEDKPLANRIAERLEQKFSVMHDSGSAVMELSFVWGDPLLAEEILQQWIQVYLTERSKSLGRNSLQGFYEAEILQLDSSVTDLKQQLQEHYTNINSIGVKERLENLTDQINRLSDLRSVKNNEAAGLQAQLQYAQNSLDKHPGEVITERELSLNPTMLDLKLKLNNLEEEKTRLLRTYLPEAAQIKQIEQSIAELKELVGKQDVRLERSQNRSPNSIIVGLRQTIVDDQLRLETLQNEVLNIDQQLAELSALRQAALTKEPEITRLVMQLEAAENSYALYTDSLEKARIDKALDDNLISNITIVEPATGNLSRVFPKTLNMLLLAFPIGLLAGALTLYVCYLLDLRIHDSDSLEERFKVPVWTAIPDMQDGSSLTPAFLASMYRFMGLLSFEQIKAEGLTVAFVSTHSKTGLSFIIGHLTKMLEREGFTVIHSRKTPAGPGEIALLDAGALQTNPAAILIMREADVHIVVAEARHTTIPMLSHALSVLNTAFQKVDGIILNRRQFEVPQKVLQRIERWQSIS